MRYANRICVGVLAVLVAMSFAGCAQRSTDSPASTTSVGVDTQEGSLMNSVRTEFTPKALRAYVECVYGDEAGRFLGSAVVEGRKTVPIAEVDGAPATAYAITYYCDPAHDMPFDIGMQQGEAVSADGACGRLSEVGGFRNGFNGREPAFWSHWRHGRCRAWTCACSRLRNQR